jgi:hypothetical protein
VFPLWGCQHNPAILEGNIEGIARSYAEPAANRLGKYDLALRGNLGLHGKTILPFIGACFKKQLPQMFAENYSPLEHNRSSQQIRGILISVL